MGWKEEKSSKNQLKQPEPLKMPDSGPLKMPSSQKPPKPMPHPGNKEVWKD